MNYDHPTYTVLREAVKEPHSGAITAAAATGGLVGSTFRSYHKAVVYSVTGICSAAGSGGTGVITVARIQNQAATLSLRDVFSPTTLAAAAQTTVNFTSPITLDSFGDFICLHGSSSAAGDIAEIGSLVWRYRLLPQSTDEPTNPG
jgi:hypothetical protein